MTWVKYLMIALVGAFLGGLYVKRHPLTTADCDWSKEIRIDKRDKLTRGTAEQILSHNELGKAECGWTE